MWKTRHFSTREVKTGTEQEILDLDNRVWIDKQEISNVPRSHRVPLHQEHLVYELEDNKVKRIARQAYHLPCHWFENFISFHGDFMRSEHGKSL